MKTLIFLLLLLFGCSQPKKRCEYFYQPAKTTLSWTAYKFPEVKKVGVKGSFKTFSITPTQQKAESVEKLLLGADLIAEASSLDTQNEGRDITIFENFFSLLKDKGVIRGKVVKVMKDQLEVDFTINQQTHRVPLSYSMGDQNQLTIKGRLNMLSFAMKEALEALAKVCPHEGVTQPYVDLELITELQHQCIPH